MFKFAATSRSSSLENSPPISLCRHSITPYPAPIHFSKIPSIILQGSLLEMNFAAVRRENISTKYKIYFLSLLSRSYVFKSIVTIWLNFSALLIAIFGFGFAFSHLRQASHVSFTFFKSATRPSLVRPDSFKSFTNLSTDV